MLFLDNKDSVFCILMISLTWNTSRFRWDTCSAGRHHKSMRSDDQLQYARTVNSISEKLTHSSGGNVSEVSLAIP